MKVWLDFVVQGVELYVILVAGFIFYHKNTVNTLWSALTAMSRAGKPKPHVYYPLEPEPLQKNQEPEPEPQKMCGSGSLKLNDIK